MKKLGAFILGGLVGGAIALLYAPRTGKELSLIHISEPTRQVR